MAKMFATAKRHTARHEVDDLDSAVAELREEADGRVDLLSELAGLHLGFEQADLAIMASRHRAMADLAFAAGADRQLAEKWISEGISRLESARQTPHGGGTPRRGN
jgi:hypothetical protein